MQIPLRRHEKLMVQDESPIPMTREAHQRLKERLTTLKNSLPEQISTTKAAADLGDRSENAEYQISKSRLRGTHRQILIIEDQLKRAVIIKTDKHNKKIELGTTVVLESEGKKYTFQILGSFETNPGKGVISDQSPLGKALMGGKKGDEINIKTGSGEKKYLILEIN
ncbi:MAG: GreA/GreB family elongation factor [Patescibacteria group bacterium]